MGKIIAAFTKQQERVVADRLRTLTRFLRVMPGGGKIEEGHWTFIYCESKDIPQPGWSNLGFKDVIHGGLGIEFKLLKRTDPFEDPGRSLMHPAATRRITYDPRKPAGHCKDRILEQWTAAIREFEDRVRKTSARRRTDIRWGILLWAPALTKFLYFEEQMERVDPADYYAEWVHTRHRGRPTRNLHIFERRTRKKRFSVTSPEKGAKIHPYFDIPSGDQGVHRFQIEEKDERPIWVSPSTLQTFDRVRGTADPDSFLLRLLSNP